MHLIVMNCTLLYYACIAIRNQETPSTPPIKEERMKQEQKAKDEQPSDARPAKKRRTADPVE